jgi:transcriptional activator for dhaKLM operon
MIPIMTALQLETTLEHAWHMFTASGTYNSADVPPPILRSWQQCRSFGVPSEGWRAAREQRSAENTALAALRPVLEDLYEFLESSCSAILLSDQDALMVDLLGDVEAVVALQRLGLEQGSDWHEARIGTNALALALSDGRPRATVGAAHWCRPLHRFAIAAAPFWGPNGEPLGALAVVSMAETYQPHMLGMVAAAAQGVQTRLQMDALLAETNQHLTELNAALEVISEGLMLIDADGRIAHLNQRVEPIIGIGARAAAGRLLTDVLALPVHLREALEQRITVAEQEALFPSEHGTLAVVCSLRPIYQQDHYVGALLTLHPPDRLRRLVQQVVGAQAQISFRDMLGESAAFQQALRQARIAANGVANVLLIGEAGSGKEMFAHAMHRASARANGPFVTLDCAAMPRTLIGTELFGYESSSADPQQSRPGKLELAHGGTLLLKSVDALSLEHQTALLHTIDARSVMRPGGRRVVPLDVRVIATTTSGLGIDIARFRPDLAARLSAYVIELPSLRERDHDLLLLIDHLLAKLNGRLGKQLVFSPDALAALSSYSWPGNIRELEIVLEQLAHTSEQSVIDVADLPAPVQQSFSVQTATGSHLANQHAHLEREAILRAGRAAGGHLGRTAQQLGISRTTLWRRMQQLGLRQTDLWRIP